MTLNTELVPFGLLAKPTGAICNLDCKYCFFLSKELLYPGSRFRMADELLEEYIKQYIEAQPADELVNIAWQGGEPTLMGVDFFRRSIEYVEKHRKPNSEIVYSLQTNGTLLDDEWCEFFKEHNFIIGISLDGTPEMNDAYRVDKGGAPTSDKVLRGLELLQEYGIPLSILTTVHAANQDHPVELYNYLVGLGAKSIQFIPIVERDNDGVTERSVNPKKYGQFLTAVFDVWLRRDVGSIFVQLFEVVLRKYCNLPGGLCVFEKTCGKNLAIEHNLDLFSCDHFIEKPGPYHLGNILDTPMIELVNSPAQIKFGNNKHDKLTNQCKQCSVLDKCQGGCPKNRFIKSKDGQDGQNYLCEGYFNFFTHVDRPMRIMADLLMYKGKPASYIMELL